MNSEKLQQVGDDLRWAVRTAYGYLIAGGAFVAAEIGVMSGKISLAPTQEQMLTTMFVTEMGMLFVSLINVGYRDSEVKKALKGGLKIQRQ